jgi:hypothetical protein
VGEIGVAASESVSMGVDDEDEAVEADWATASAATVGVLEAFLALNAIFRLDPPNYCKFSNANSKFPQGRFSLLNSRPVPSSVGLCSDFASL